MRRPQWTGILAWVLTVLAAVLNATSLVMLIGVNDGAAPVPPLFGGPGGAITPVPAVFGAATVAVISVVGGFLAARRSENAIGWLFAVCGLSGAGFYFANQYATAALVTWPGALPGGMQAAWLAHWLWLVAFAMIVYLLLVFPDGRLPSRRWRPMGWLAGVVLSFLALLLALAPGPLGSFPVNNPFGLAGFAGVAARTGDYATWVWLGLPAVAVASLVARYRGSREVERLQVKYLVVASVLMLVAVAFHQAELLPAPLGYMTLFVAAVSMPFSVALAVLRYRLYDIDQIISRTVSYALLTGVLVSVYLGVVFALQQLLRPITGESQLAVAAATLVVATLFQPARRRVQSVVDRRFNRARYDAQRTIDAFRARLRNEVNLEQLGTELVGAVRSTVQPADVSLWLRPREAETET